MCCYASMLQNHRFYILLVQVILYLWQNIPRKTFTVRIKSTKVFPLECFAMYGTLSSKSKRFSPYFGINNYKQHKLDKVRIKSFRFARECVLICAFMDVITKLELCFHEQTHIVAKAACRVGSKQFLS